MEIVVPDDYPPTYASVDQVDLQRLAAYGVVIHAWPVIVANVLVTAVAVWTSLGRTVAAATPDRG